jgi:hypothetical protein
MHVRLVRGGDMTPEAKVLTAIVRYLTEEKRQGKPIWWVKLHGSHMQRAGIPDLHVCYHGQAIYLEVKAQGGELTKLQSHTMQAIFNAGGRVEVVRSVSDVAMVLGDVERQRNRLETESTAN